MLIADANSLDQDKNLLDVASDQDHTVRHSSHFAVCRKNKLDQLTDSNLKQMKISECTRLMRENLVFSLFLK